MTEVMQSVHLWWLCRVNKGLHCALQGRVSSCTYAVELDEKFLKAEWWAALAAGESIVHLLETSQFCT